MFKMHHIVRADSFGRDIRFDALRPGLYRCVGVTVRIGRTTSAKSRGMSKLNPANCVQLPVTSAVPVGLDVEGSFVRRMNNRTMTTSTVIMQRQQGRNSDKVYCCGVIGTPSYSMLLLCRILHC
jgi:hypothetical protein